MYYPVRIVYAGPNRADRDPNAYGNRDYYSICARVQRTNMSNQELTEGWLGQTNDWSYHALGEFETLDEARESIRTDSDVEVREWWDGSGVREPDEGTLEVWIPRNLDGGDLITVDWDSEDLSIETAEGVHWLYYEDNSECDSEQPWQDAADTLELDARDSDARAPIIERLQSQGWTVETVCDAGWGACYVVGRPPATS